MARVASIDAGRFWDRLAEGPATVQELSCCVNAPVSEVWFTVRRLEGMGRVVTFVPPRRACDRLPDLPTVALAPRAGLA